MAKSGSEYGSFSIISTPTSPFSPPSAEEIDLLGSQATEHFHEFAGILREPELVTILEDEPLTQELIDLEQEKQDNEERDEFEFTGSQTLSFNRSRDDFSGTQECSETTALLDRSSGSTIRMEGEREHRAEGFSLSMSASTASLFLPSVQLSMYSSVKRSHERWTESHVGRNSVSMSVTKPKLPKTASLSLTLIEKVCLDRRAPSLLVIWNMLSMIQGCGGVMGIPYAVAQGGWLAILTIVLLAVSADYTTLLLIDCLYQISPKSKERKHVFESYADIAESVWGKVGARVVDFLISSFMFSCAVLSVMLLGTSIGDLFQTTDVSVTSWCIVSAFALLPTVFIKRLSVLAWLSMLAVVSLLLCLLVIIGYSTSQYEDWDINHIPVSTDVSAYAISIGIILFSFCGHGLFPSIEATMKYPDSLHKVTHIAFGINVIVKVLIGMVCVLLFGVVTSQIVTSNISKSENVVVRIFVTLLIIINVYFTYPLVMYPVNEAFDNIFLSRFPWIQERFEKLWLCTSRTFLVFLSLLVGVLVPQFGLVMSIFGSVEGACLSFIFPCVFHLHLKKQQWYESCIKLLIIVFGAIAGSTGFIVSCISLRGNMECCGTLQ